MKMKDIPEKSRCSRALNTPIGMRRGYVSCPLHQLNGTTSGRRLLSPHLFAAPQPRLEHPQQDTDQSINRRQLLSLDHSTVSALLCGARCQKRPDPVITGPVKSHRLSSIATMISSTYVATWCDISISISICISISIPKTAISRARCCCLTSALSIPAPARPMCVSRAYKVCVCLSVSAFPVFPPTNRRASNPPPRRLYMLQRTHLPNLVI